MTLTVRNNVYYALAVLTLAASSYYLHDAQASGGLQIIKGPLPIRKPLRDLNRKAIAPFRFVQAVHLSGAVVEELGTENYVNWRVDDSGKTPPDPSNIASVTVTYYTGVQDQIPHVPEKCMTQGGYAQDTSDELIWKLPTLGREARVRRVSFYSPRDTQRKLFVYYTISVNGDYYTSRDSARFRLVDASDTHLYYSKVEMGFSAFGEVKSERIDRRARTLMDKMLAELEENHWPPREWAKGGPPDQSS